MVTTLSSQSAQCSKLRWSDKAFLNALSNSRTSESSHWHTQDACSYKEKRKFRVSEAEKWVKNAYPCVGSRRVSSVLILVNLLATVIFLSLYMSFLPARQTSKYKQINIIITFPTSNSYFKYHAAPGTLKPV